MMKPNPVHKIIILSLVFLSMLMAKDKAQKYYESADYQQALKQYEKVLSQHPEWEEAHFGKGAVLYQAGQIEEAMKEFEQAISIDDPVKKSAVFYNIANGLYQAQKLDQSLEFYKKAIELNPRDMDAKYNFELVKRQLQQQQQQQNQQQQDKEKEEPSENAKKVKEQCDKLVEQRKYKEALKLMTDLLKKDKTAANYQEYIKRLEDVVKIL